MTPNGRLTPEQLADIERYMDRVGQGVADDDARALVAELKAVTREREELQELLDVDRFRRMVAERDQLVRERDHAREKLEGTRNWLTRVEGELTAVTRQRDEIARQFDNLVASITPAAASNAEQNQVE